MNAAYSPYVTWVVRSVLSFFAQRGPNMPLSGKALRQFGDQR